MVRGQDIGILVCDSYKDIQFGSGSLPLQHRMAANWVQEVSGIIVSLKIAVGFKSQLGVHDMQQASRKAEPGDYKHAVNDM